MGRQERVGGDGLEVIWKLWEDEVDLGVCVHEYQSWRRRANGHLGSDITCVCCSMGSDHETSHELSGNFGGMRCTNVDAARG
jgi:hypothetical protein